MMMIFRMPYFSFLDTAKLAKVGLEKFLQKLCIVLSNHPQKLAYLLDYSPELMARMTLPWGQTYPKPHLIWSSDKQPYFSYHSSMTFLIGGQHFKGQESHNYC